MSPNGAGRMSSSGPDLTGCFKTFAVALIVSAVLAVIVVFIRLLIS